MSTQADFKVKKGLVVNTTASFLSTITATSTNTGAVQISGGAGIAKDVYVGGTINLANATSATSTNSGALQVLGGVGVGGSLYAGNIYSNGVLLGGAQTSATNATNLAGGLPGQIPYQWSVGVTTFTNQLVYSNNAYLQVNSNTVLTTATVIGQVGVTTTATTTTLYIGFIPGIQGVSADFGLISDLNGPIYYDWGTF